RYAVRKQRGDGSKAVVEVPKVRAGRVVAIPSGVPKDNIEDLQGKRVSLLVGKLIERSPYVGISCVAQAEQLAQLRKIASGLIGRRAGIKKLRFKRTEIHLTVCQPTGDADACARDDVCAIERQIWIAAIADTGESNRGAVGIVRTDPEVKIAAGQNFESSGATNLNIPGERTVAGIENVRACLSRRAQW